MSEENKVNTGSEDAQGSAESKEDFVSKKAYEEIKADMFKFKTQMKEIEAERNQLKADKDAVEREKLEEQGKWKELYEKQKQKLQETEANLSSSKNQFVDFHKKQAVISKLGGLKKDDYAKFIDTNAVDVQENGKIDDSSVEAEVNRIKEQFPELIKGSDVKSFNQAPAKKTEVSKDGGKTPTSYNDHKSDLLAKLGGKKQ